MKRAAILAAVLLLAGCQTKQLSELNYAETKVVVERIKKTCAEQGLKQGTAEYKTCTQIEVSAEDAKRKNALETSYRMRAVGAALNGVSQNYFRAAQSGSNYNNSVTCHSVPSPAGITSMRCN